MNKLERMRKNCFLSYTEFQQTVYDYVHVMTYIRTFQNQHVNKILFRKEIELRIELFISMINFKKNCKGNFYSI